MPEEQPFTLDLEHGSIAVTVRQELRCCLEPRPAEHPFANGNAPVADRAGINPEAGGAGRRLR